MTLVDLFLLIFVALAIGFMIGGSTKNDNKKSSN